jgi:signal transduction histidine kinase
LRLEVLSHDEVLYETESGEISAKSIATFHRVFAQPFSFLRMTLFCEKFPPSGGRRLLNIMRILTGAIILIGLVTMYQSARTVIELSERRAQFVSSVTHELKTPLTNIQMYSEMLEQGVAQNREREEEYFQVIGAESRRLSRLIEQVLEFSKLERKQRRFHLQEGTFDDVLSEVQQILQESLDRNGFVLNVEKAPSLRFRYDRDVMIQILVNVVGNSIKFGKNAPVREIAILVMSEGSHIRISVSDTGPGIPEKDLKKVFDDFYRGDHGISQATRGTGIGLALVKRYVTALGGSVHASNNDGAGCTISMSLPA